METWKTSKYLSNFADPIYLKKHIRRVHLKLKNKVYECDLCLKVFEEPKMLQNHVDFVHRGVKNHKCPFCEKSFGYDSTLRFHKRRVSNETSIAPLILSFFI